MTVNVYTYYENKLNLDSFSRECAAKKKPLIRLDSWSFRGFLLGSLLAMVYVACDRPDHPTLMLAFWAQTLPWMMGYVMDKASSAFGSTAHRFVRALKGEPLDEEDLRRLGVLA